MFDRIIDGCRSIPSRASPRQPASSIDVSKLERAYFDEKPDPSNPAQLVSFGTSGHRGTSLNGSFTEAHILAITQAICEYRAGKGIDGPIFMGKDTHALSDAAQRTALEVLAANGIDTVIQQDNGFTPTPVVSHAIFATTAAVMRDSLTVSSSRLRTIRPKTAASNTTRPMAARRTRTSPAGFRIAPTNCCVPGITVSGASPPKPRCAPPPPIQRDLIRPYVEDLRNVVHLDAIRVAGLKIGVDPLGGSSLPYWEPVADHYGLNLTVVNKTIDPRFAFMTVDHDGKIRMDCSSPYAMASLVKLKDDFDIAWGNDPDADRHGIVTRSPAC